MILAAKIFKRFFLISLLFLGACSKDNEILSISGQIFGTFYDIKFEASQKDFTKVNKEINNVFISINECCSTYKNDSLVSLKRDKKNTNSVKQKINDYFQDVIKISVRANKTARGFILFENYDYFNAVAKGYAVDVLSSKFNELNIKNFFINIGGEIRAEGKKNNTFWKIGIENPSPNQQSLFKPFEFKQNLSIATSGNYRNPDHIIGIEGKSIDQDILSISVIDKKSTAFADALATGLFALGEVDLIKANIIDNSIPALLIFKDNAKLKSFESKQWMELLQ